MPSIVKITSHTFRNDETNEQVDYKRLSIIGVINGETRTLQIKLNKTELMLAELLLSSTGNPDESNAINTLGDHKEQQLKAALPESGIDQEPFNAGFSQ